MKHGLLIMGFFLLSLATNAQVVIEPNPSYTNPANRPFFDELLDEEEYLDELTPEPPSENDICFDKK